MRRLLNDEQVAAAYDLYINEKLSTYELAKIFNCAAGSIQKEFKKAKFLLRNNSHAKQKYLINENIFDIIDTEEKAYWLGFLYADGNVSKTNRTRLSLAEEDKEVVEKFSLFIFNQNRVKTYIRPKNKIGQNLLYVDVCNKHIAASLNELGCPPKKTFILTFPEWLDINLRSHFIRGYFDGDGCLSNYKNKQKGRGKSTLNIVVNEYDRSGFSVLSTLEFLTFIYKIFGNLGVNCSLSKRHKAKQNNNYTLTVSGNQQIQKLMDWIYKDATIFLQRKYNKYQDLIKINDKKRIEKNVG